MSLPKAPNTEIVQNHQPQVAYFARRSMKAGGEDIQFPSPLSEQDGREVPAKKSHQVNLLH